MNKNRLGIKYKPGLHMPVLDLHRKSNRYNKMNITVITIQLTVMLFEESFGNKLEVMIICINEEVNELIDLSITEPVATGLCRSACVGRKS
jgi:hypothetical protein